MLGAVLLLIGSPVLYLLALAIDIVRHDRFALTRTLAMGQAYLLCEFAGISACAWIWLRYRRDNKAFLDATFRLQCWWAGSLYRAGVRLFSLKVEIEGDEVLEPGPVLVLSRHVSPIDNLLPAVLISVAHGTQLRWVINRSLLRDPCLDLVGNRLPNCFVANSSSDSEAEIRRVEALGRRLGPSDGVLIFPEGGLFSASRRQRVLARLEASGEPDLHQRAAALQYLLPPRLGGVLALLDSAPGVDTVFMAHTGLDDGTHYRDILRGQLIGRRVLVHFWREPASAIPDGREARIVWLYRQWQRMDNWIAAHREPGGQHAG
jgi:hypothetical protein